MEPAVWWAWVRSSDTFLFSFLASASSADNFLFSFLASASSAKTLSKTLSTSSFIRWRVASSVFVNTEHNTEQCVSIIFHFKLNHLFSSRPKQFGFLKGCSTSLQILDKWTDSVNGDLQFLWGSSNFNPPQNQYP